MEKNYQSGILLTYKPQGITSNNFLQNIRRKLNLHKVGHAGTLDKLACGAFIVCANNATKIQDAFLHADKKYRFQILFNVETTTGDLNGDISLKQNIKISETKLKQIIKKYDNYTYNQLPPNYSAIKIKGKKLSDYARTNTLGEIEIHPRKITIYSLNLSRKISDNIYELEALVSKGTYIRSLAQDIARDLGTCGTCQLIERISYHNILNTNLVLKKFIEIDNISITDINPVEELFNFTKHILSEDEYVRVKNSNTLYLPQYTNKYLCLINNGQKIYIYIQKSVNIYKPVYKLVNFM